jgi:hypothetical protein
MYGCLTLVLCVCVCVENGTILESIRDSFTNTINELNRELMAMKEAYDQLDDEKQQLADELQRRTTELEGKRSIGMLVTRSAKRMLVVMLLLL